MYISHLHRREFNSAYDEIDYIRSLIDLERDWLSDEERQGSGLGKPGNTSHRSHTKPDRNFRKKSLESPRRSGL